MLRSGGVMRGIIASGHVDADDARRTGASDRADGRRGPRARRDVCGAVRLACRGRRRARGVPRARRSVAPGASCAIAAYDLGIKRNILRRLAAHNCDVHVFPAATPAAELLAVEPDGVFLSNGPGDPAALPYATDNVKQLVATRRADLRDLPRHQILGLALGGKTFKLKFGHRGGNHPVKNLADEQGRDHVAEPRLRRRSRFAAGRRARHPPQPVRRHRRGPTARGQARLLRPVPPGGVARPARRGLPVPTVSG